MGWRDENDDTPKRIYEAMENNRLTTVRRLLAQHPEFLRLDNGWDMWLWRAARSGNIALMELLIELGLSVDEPNGNPTDKPEGPIDCASGNGQLEAVRWLLEHGARINFTVNGKPRCMPLTMAAMSGHLEIVKLLVARGADIHASWHCMNSLTQAEDHGHHEVAEYLRSLGVKDPRETTPPNYSGAHARIKETMLANHGTLSEWVQTIPGTPAVAIHMISTNAKDRREQFLFTVGLSDLNLPNEEDRLACAELTLNLPLRWKLDEKSLTDPRWNWPIEWLRNVVVQLRQATVWPVQPAIFPAADFPAKFHSSTNLSSWLLLKNQSGTILAPDCRMIDFYRLFPIYRQEIAFIEKRGVDEFVQHLDALGVPIQLQIRRRNTAENHT